MTSAGITQVRDAMRIARGTSWGIDEGGALTRPLGSIICAKPVIPTLSITLFIAHRNCSISAGAFAVSRSCNYILVALLATARTVVASQASAVTGGSLSPATQSEGPT